jgi:hypothetical protein
MARLSTSKRTNPKHQKTLLSDGFSWGECASFFEIMSDGTAGTVRKDFIEYWLRKLIFCGEKKVMHKLILVFHRQ